MRTSRHLLTEKVSGIYQIRNGVNGKVYIGSASDIGRRWHEHRKALYRNNHYNQRLMRAWLKYGPDSFTYLVLEVVSERTRLIEREQYWLDAARSYERTIGYNICPKAYSVLGIKHSDEVRARARLRIVSQATRALMRAAKANMSEETRAKMSASAKKRRHTPETKAKIIAILKARPPVSAETRAKLIYAASNKSPEWRAKIGEANKRRDPAIKARMLAAAQAYWAARKTGRENVVAT